MAMGSGSEGKGSIFRFDTRQIVVAGIIGGIALFLGFTRLGFIPVPIPLIGNATIMHIPAIVGGALEGPIVGLLAGAIFGIFSFLQADNPVFLNPVVAIAPAHRGGGVGRLRGLRRWSVDLAAAAADCWDLSQYGRGGRSRHTLRVAARCHYSGHPAAGHGRSRSGRSRHRRHRRGVMLFRSGRTTAPENESDEERRY